MQTIRIQTTQQVEVEYELAGLGDRMIAFLVDLMIYLAYGMLTLLLFSQFSFWGAGIWLQLTALLPVLCYHLVCEVFLQGQSLGKRARKIRVISVDGREPGLGQYLIRWIFRIIDITISQGVVAIVSISLSRKAQRLGDLLAGTTVVRTTMSNQFGHTLFAPTDQHYQPLFPQVADRLNDGDISLLKEVLNRKLTGTIQKKQLVEKAYQRTRQILGVRTDYPHEIFLETVIRDYNYITSREE